MKFVSLCDAKLVFAGMSPSSRVPSIMATRVAEVDGDLWFDALKYTLWIG